MLPADQKPPRPLEPGKEALDEPEKSINGIPHNSIPKDAWLDDDAEAIQDEWRDLVPG